MLAGLIDSDGGLSSNNPISYNKEYHGIKYEVDYADDGFVCNGMKYNSLSSLATKITGHKTNAPKFFGVSKK